MTIHPHTQQIRRFCDLLYEPGNLRELRIRTPKGVSAGYYNDLDLLAAHAAAWSGNGNNCYITLNPVNPDCLSRAGNRVVRADRGGLTKDSEITARRMLLVDCDAVRLSGIPSNEAEHQAAIRRAFDVRDHLRDLGWPEPIVTDSGNGASLLYRVDLPADDGGLTRRVLDHLSTRFSDESVKIDRVNHNASRITRLIGTLNVKGENLPDRPHRPALILDTPAILLPASRPLLESLGGASITGEPATAQDDPYGFDKLASSEPFDMTAWLRDRIAFTPRPGQCGDLTGTWYDLPYCPFKGPSHTDGNAAIFHAETGQKIVKCHHDKCAGKGWKELAAIFDAVNPVDAAPTPLGLDAAALRAGGIEHPTQGGWVFDSFAAVGDAVKLAGGSFAMPGVVDRTVTLKPHKDRKRIVAEMLKEKDDPVKLPGWVLLKNRTWLQVIDANSSAATIHSEHMDLIRHVISPGGGRNIGWTITIHNEWIDQSKDNCRSVLSHLGYAKAESDAILGGNILQGWKLVDRPFQPEYPEPGKLVWNRFGAQLAFAPTLEDRPMVHPHYDMVLEHCGAGLTAAVKHDDWCQRHGLRTGADYLRVYAASLFQRPLQLLPWLFFFGKQYSGKSSFHEMLGGLMNKGYTKVDKAFTRNTTFNGEFAGTILAVVEEADLTKFPTQAYNTMKDITTSPKITIERKGWECYETVNMLHVIQVGNMPSHCPILEEDDTRVVVCEVGVLDMTQRLSKDFIQQKWIEEAPDFLRTLLSLKLPERATGDDRLYLPVLTTPAKWDVIQTLAKLLKVDASERPSARMAQAIQEQVASLAESGWLVKRTSKEILQRLREIGVEDLPKLDRVSEDQIGSAIGHLELDGFVVQRGRTNSARWITIARPGKDFAEVFAEPEWSDEDLAADDQRTADLLEALP